MEWTIREARLADCAAITRLNREEMGYDFPEERTQEKLRACLANPAHKVFVAESGGEVVGYLHLENYDVLYFPHMKNVLGIAVAGACRRQGVGRARGDLGQGGRGRGGAAGLRGGAQRRPRLLPAPGLHREQAAAQFQKAAVKRCASNRNVE